MVRVRKGVRIRFSVGVRVRVRTGQGLKLVVEQYGGQIIPIKFKKKWVRAGLKVWVKICLLRTNTKKKKTAFKDFGIFFEKLGLGQDSG